MVREQQEYLKVWSSDLTEASAVLAMELPISLTQPVSHMGLRGHNDFYQNLLCIYLQRTFVPNSASTQLAVTQKSYILQSHLYYGEVHLPPRRKIPFIYNYSGSFIGQHMEQEPIPFGVIMQAFLVTESFCKCGGWQAVNFVTAQIQSSLHLLDTNQGNKWAGGHPACYFPNAAVTRYLQHNKFIDSQFWSLEVQNRGVSRAMPPLKAVGRSFSQLLAVCWQTSALLGLQLHSSNLRLHYNVHSSVCLRLFIIVCL